MFTRLFSLLTTNIFIPNYLNVLDRENDIIKCQILVEIIIIEDNIFHLLWRICVISFISIIYRFQTKWLPRRRRSRTRSPLVCIYISLTGKYLIIYRIRKTFCLTGSVLSVVIFLHALFYGRTYYKSFIMTRTFCCFRCLRQRFLEKI